MTFTKPSRLSSEAVHPSGVPRYAVGIDLGTTHTVVAYADLHERSGADASIALLHMSQTVASGQCLALPLLSSVRYHAARDEVAPADGLPPGALPVADDGTVVMGPWARALGAQVPGRLVSSAKSWLSHPAVDRQAPILPWGAPPEVPRISPVAASASYLAYVRAAWNQQFPAHPLEAQELVLTVPASFDEGARALTLAAARQAGLPTLRLVEEPQAVLYDWLMRHRGDLAQALAGTRLVLVCDVGGGTTDLSLIQVDSSSGEPELTRIGVGNHLMLGGDNMDLALAHAVEARLSPAAPEGQRLTASQMSQLIERCRVAKEQLLAADAPAQVTVTLLGGGSRLVGASRSATLTHAEVQQWLVDGFFPQVDVSAQAQQARTGIVEFGLPYARDPGVTRHIADFLRQHPTALPDTVLLNGGVFHADALVQRLTHTLAAWRGAPLRLLHNDNPDVAVARGAVAYTLAQRGWAPKIGGGAARSYFLQLEGEQSICILPRGSAPGQSEVLPDRTFSLRLGQPVRFHLLSAVADAADHAPYALGEVLDHPPAHFQKLPPIATVIRATNPSVTPASGQKDTTTARVQLVTAFTEVGTLHMQCVSMDDPSERWSLEFDLRHDAPASDASAALPHAAAQPPNARLQEAMKKINRVFGSGAQAVATKDVKQLRQQLENLLGAREQWSLAQLRQLFDALWQQARGRKRSAEHERAWLNLAGYCLRPGFGDPLDAWRLQQLWPQFDLGVQHSKDKQVCTEWWTLWRRVAGGLDTEQQLRLLQDFGHNLHTNEQGPLEGGSRPVKGSTDDMLRLGAALERIPAAYKQEVGDWLMVRLNASLMPAQGQTDQGSSTADALTLWALARIGAREPLQGTGHEVVSAQVAEGWIRSLLALDWRRHDSAAFAAVHLARLTDDRARDVSPAVRQEISTRLHALKVPALWAQMVLEKVALDATTERRVYGEALPPGLRLVY